jgi:hypothetical protein
MKLRFLLAFLSIYMTNSYSNAQKVDLDPWRFTIEYRNLPDVALDKSYTTYNVEVQNSGSFKDNVSDMQIIEGVAIPGWKRVDTKGHLTVVVSFRDFIISRANVVERVEETKDKDGKVTGRKYFYQPVIEYNYQGRANVKSYKGDDLRNIGLAGASTWKGQETSSSKEANDYLNNNRQSLRDQLIRETVNEKRAVLANDLSRTYGFARYTSPDLVYLLDSKKHPENEGHYKVVRALKDDLTKMKYDQTIESTKALFAPHIKYLEETIPKYNKDEKGDRKMRYAAYYALGKISYWLDNPEATIKYGELLIANDYDPKDGKELVKMGTELRKLFDKHKIDSRHFPIDTDKFEGPK